MQALFGGGAPDSQEDGNAEPLDEEQVMENARVTCDIFIHNLLSQTSHTVQWLPYEEEDAEYSAFTKKFFLLGTHKLQESETPIQDELYVASVRVPKFSHSVGQTIDYSRLKKDHSKVSIVKTFKHQGDVAKARAMKQDWRTFASILNTGDIAVYQNKEDSANEDPIMKLTGLVSEGFGLSWSPFKKGILTAATAQTLCVWDLEAGSEPIFNVDDAHQGTINDVKFSNLNENLIGTASDDNNYKLWDLRTIKDSNSFIHSYKASEDDLLVISFNHKNEFLFATGGEQTGMLNVWDIRMPKYYINDLLYHKGPVSQIEWSPACENLFMSSSSDGKVYVWDHSKTGEEQARYDYEDGPPELIFPHESHREANIEDICWSPFEGESGRTVVSVDQDMGMQVWRMSEDFFFNQTDLVDNLATIKDSDLE